MKQSLFQIADEGILAYSRAQATLAVARKQMLSALIPFIVKVVNSEMKKPGYKCGVPYGVLKVRVSEMLHAYYHSPAVKKSIPKGRHIADGMIVLAVDLRIVDNAIQWAIDCDIVCLTYACNTGNGNSSGLCTLKKQ